MQGMGSTPSTLNNSTSPSSHGMVASPLKLFHLGISMRYDLIWQYSTVSSRRVARHCQSANQSSSRSVHIWSIQLRCQIGRVWNRYEKQDTCTGWGVFRPHTGTGTVSHFAIPVPYRYIAVSNRSKIENFAENGGRSSRVAVVLRLITNRPARARRPASGAQRPGCAITPGSRYRAPEPGSRSACAPDFFFPCRSSSSAPGNGGGFRPQEMASLCSGNQVICGKPRWKKTRTCTRSTERKKIQKQVKSQQKQVSAGFF